MLSLRYCLTICACLSATTLFAANGRWGAYDTERGAWGGNGGWWGDSKSDWYGQYGTPEDHSNYTGGYGYSPSYYSNGYNNNYYYDNGYPYSQNYYGPGVGAGASVDGAGLYFNVR